MEVQPVSSTANEPETTSVGSITDKLVDILLLSAEEEGRHKILVQFQQQLELSNREEQAEESGRKP